MHYKTLHKCIKKVHKKNLHKIPLKKKGMTHLKFHESKKMCMDCLRSHLEKHLNRELCAFS